MNDVASGSNTVASSKPRLEWSQPDHCQPSAYVRWWLNRYYWKTQEIVPIPDSWSRVKGGSPGVPSIELRLTWTGTLLAGVFVGLAAGVNGMLERARVHPAYSPVAIQTGVAVVLCVAGVLLRRRLRTGVLVILVAWICLVVGSVLLYVRGVRGGGAYVLLVYVTLALEFARRRWPELA
jgi:hypothetical protein